tara:strand:- start:91 stop:246 length:156 start_codon:yes stop_codon:yes gene_type:complete
MLSIVPQGPQNAGRNIELSPTLSTPPKAFFQLQCGPLLRPVRRLAGQDGFG